jgi:hypothetical protein
MMIAIANKHTSSCPGEDPGIQNRARRWMAGSSPAMREDDAVRASK